MFEKGLAARPNRQIALHYLETGLSQTGNHEMEYFLGHFHERANDYISSYHYYNQAANHGIVKAFTKLGHFHERGLVDGTINYAEAFRCFQFASDHDDAEAVYRLARFYEIGNQVEPDLVTAFHLYKKSADLGNPMSCLKTGMFLEYGTGCSINLNLAFIYYSKAADANVRDAVSTLGFFYLRGRNVPRDLPNAEIYFAKAAQLGCKNAKRELNNLKKLTRKVEIRKLVGNDLHKLIVDAKKNENSNAHSKEKFPNLVKSLMLNANGNSDILQQDLLKLDRRLFEENKPVSNPFKFDLQEVKFVNPNRITYPFKNDSNSAQRSKKSHSNDGKQPASLSVDEKSIANAKLEQRFENEEKISNENTNIDPSANRTSNLGAASSALAGVAALTAALLIALGFS
jgi:hypothetical protein